MLGPRLVGSTCVMRPPLESEVETMASWFENPDVTRAILRRFPPSLADEREWFDRVARDPNSLLWGIEAGGRLVGTSGVHAIDWMNQHGQTGTVIGDPGYWRRGIGAESMRLRTEFLFTQTTLRKLVSSYLETNPASGRAQAKCGYREVGRRREHYFRDGRWVDEILTEVLREEWLALNRPP